LEFSGVVNVVISNPLAYSYANKYISNNSFVMIKVIIRSEQAQYRLFSKPEKEYQH